ncbi:MAG: hypothetical protein HYT87_18640 [Nitrospirae bacterium]|nr:hypothetical protein [Nitrospirota bacterium]
MRSLRNVMAPGSVESPAGGRGLGSSTATRAGAVDGLVQLLAALVLTWPLAPHLFDRLGGNAGDPLQTLWSWWWLHDAIMSLKNPFFSDHVYHPQGATLIFQTFDLPSAAIAFPFWGVLPPVAIYNVAVLFAFILTGYGMVRLLRELGVDRFTAHGMAILFSATPYHMAHAMGHQQLVNMGWIPLFLVRAHRLLAGRGTLRDGVWGGFHLALATLASWYHLLFVMVLIPFLALHALIAHRRTVATGRLWGRLVSLGVIFLALAGPLLRAVMIERNKEPVEGAHDSAEYSADLEAFFIPNEIQAWSRWTGAKARQWTGNKAETAVYTGYVVLTGAIAGIVLGGGAARVYGLAGLAAAVLSMGPYLQIGGEIHRDVRMPYLMLERLLPPIQFMGVPSRLGYVMYLGLLVSMGLGLTRLWEKRIRSGQNRKAFVLGIGVFSVVLLEYAPRQIRTTRLQVPAPMREWAQDTDSYAVLDLSDPYLMLWHAMHHRKPIVGGNLSRTPERLSGWYNALEMVQATDHPTPRPAPIFTRIDPDVSFDWGDGSPDPRLEPDGFRIEWSGYLKVPAGGNWIFHVASDDSASLWIDEKLIVEIPGVHPLEWKSGRVRLEKGRHPIRLNYEEGTGKAGVILQWEWPGIGRLDIPAEALTTDDGKPGLEGTYSKFVAGCGRDPQGILRQLRDLQVRYVVTRDGGDDTCVATDLGMEKTYEGEGVRIHRVGSP